MHVASHDPARAGLGGGPALYLGYCQRSRRYRMMDLPEYLSNVQQGMSRLVTDGSTLYQDAFARLYGTASPAGTAVTRGGCGCRSDSGCDCHCECCVCDADVLVHGRCGELRRIPVTFENETRHERPVKLTLDRFVTAGGRELGWPSQLSESEFTLRACESRTILVAVQLQCPPPGTGEPGTPGGPPNEPPAAADRAGSVDRCEVGYATLRAEGCLVRPVVLAVAVLPDDCDTYRRPCGCGCCH
jgi:hypothetical protein